MKNREYQYDFAEKSKQMYDFGSRVQKANTIIAILRDYFGLPLFRKDDNDISLLTVGCSTGIMDDYLSSYVCKVTGVDIDFSAIEFANKSFKHANLEFKLADGLKLPFNKESFDVVICSHVYEHVVNPERMMAEIYRVLKKKGVCYFAATNKITWNEPDYDLPLLSLLPRRLANIYVRKMGKGDYYHEVLYTYRNLLKLVSRFKLHDYTDKSLQDPKRYEVEYLISDGGIKQRLALLVYKYLKWLFPSYIWILEKE